MSWSRKAVMIILELDRSVATRSFEDFFGRAVLMPGRVVRIVSWSMRCVSLWEVIAEGLVYECNEDECPVISPLCWLSSLR